MKRFWPIITATSLGMGMMLSPENLAALGRSAGDLGSGIILAILAAVLVHRGTIAGYSRELRDESPQTVEASVIGQAFGRVSSIACFLCCRVLLAVTLATAILATAGFVFNEVFLHWFPNFAFAALLLAGILVLNLSSDSLARRLQAAFVLAAMASLTALSLMGLWGLGGEPSTVAPRPLALLPPRQLLIPMMALIGFDLALFNGGGRGETSVPAGSAMTASIAAAALALGLWTWVSTTAVPGARLAQSTIPHMIAARAVGGEWGRILMGVTVLSGSAAAINALFIALPLNLLGVVSAALGPPTASRIKWVRITALMVLGLLVSGMLALGMAGEPAIDAWVRAGMLFWLLSYILFHGAGLWLELRKRSASSTRPPRAELWKTMIVLAILGMSLIILIKSDPYGGALTAFMTKSAAACLLISWLTWRVAGRRRQTN